MNLEYIANTTIYSRFIQLNCICSQTAQTAQTLLRFETRKLRWHLTHWGRRSSSLQFISYVINMSAPLDKQLVGGVTLHCLWAYFHASMRHQQTGKNNIRALRCRAALLSLSQRIKHLSDGFMNIAHNLAWFVNDKFGFFVGHFFLISLTEYRVTDACYNCRINDP